MQVSFNRLYWATLIWLTTAQAKTNIRFAPLDTVQIGPFYVTNCKSQDNHMSTLLRTLSNVLQPVIRELRSSTSSDAYTTFFKDIVYAPFVRDILSNIAMGATVIPEAGAKPSRPRLICVDGRDQVILDKEGEQEDVYDLCRSRDDSLGLTILPKPYIFLCPEFFTLPAIPVRSAASCYTIDPHRDRFVQNGKSLVNYQMWNVMHEMVHFYANSRKAKVVDEYGINACLTLLGQDAIFNPNSYSYYVANVRLGCTDFPTVRTRPPGRGFGVELLEVDANTTALGAGESDALVFHNVSVHATPPV